MDRLTLIVLLVCGVFAVLVAARLRRSHPPPAPPKNVLRVDLDHRSDHPDFKLFDP